MGVLKDARLIWMLRYTLLLHHMSKLIIRGKAWDSGLTLALAVQCLCQVRAMHRYVT